MSWDPPPLRLVLIEPSSTTAADANQTATVYGEGFVNGLTLQLSDRSNLKHITLEPAIETDQRLTCVIALKDLAPGDYTLSASRPSDSELNVLPDDDRAELRDGFRVMKAGLS